MRVSIVISLIILFTCCCCYVNLSKGEVIEDDLVLIRLLRPKRQFFYDTTVQGTWSGRRTLFDWNGRKVEGYGQMSRTWDPRKPTVFGGGFDGTSNRGKYTLNSGYQRDKGAKVGTGGRYNLYKSDKTTVDAFANYDRQLAIGSTSNRGSGIDIQRHE